MCMLVEREKIRFQSTGCTLTTEWEELGAEPFVSGA